MNDSSSSSSSQPNDLILRNKKIVKRSLQVMEKKRKTVPDVKEIYPSYGRLPYDLLFNVFLNLHTASLFTCKSVSKSWCSLIQDPLFISRFEKKFHPKKPLEWVIQDSEKLQVYSVDENGAAKSIGTYLPGEHTSGISDTRYFNGLVCSYNKKEFTLSVFDLTTEVTFQLPRQKYKFGSGEFRFEFGVDLCTKKHKVLSWMEYRGARFKPSDFQVLVFEENKTSTWKSLQNTPENLPYFGQSATTANGTMFWFCFDTIISFNLNTEKFRMIKRPDMTNPLNFGVCMFGFEGGLCLIEQPVPMLKDKNSEKLNAHFNIRAMWMLEDTETSSWAMMRGITLPLQLKPKGLCQYSHFSAWGNEILIGGSCGWERVLFVYSFLTQQFKRINVRGLSEWDSGVKESCREG